MKKQTIIPILLVLLFLPFATAAQECYNNVAELPVTCTGGSINSDQMNGCRNIDCGLKKVMVCDKPDGAVKQYFEMYNKGNVGGNPNTTICLAGVCMKNEGYIKSPNYPICRNLTTISDPDGVSKMTKLPTTAVSLGAGMSNEADIFTIDGKYARFLFSNDTMIASGFNFNIPNNATIKGIRVQALASQQEDRTLGTVQGLRDPIPNLYHLSIDGSESRTFMTPGQGGAFLVYPLGGDMDLWGRTFSPAQINNMSMTIAMDRLPASEAVGWIDSINVTIFYTLPNSSVGGQPNGNNDTLAACQAQVVTLKAENTMLKQAINDIKQLIAVFGW